MLLYVVLKPDKTPVATPYLSMEEAQIAIAEIEPDPVKQGEYQIHPIASVEEANRLKIKVIEEITLECFDGEYIGQDPVAVHHRTFQT